MSAGLGEDKGRAGQRQGRAEAGQGRGRAEAGQERGRCRTGHCNPVLSSTRQVQHSASGVVMQSSAGPDRPGQDKQGQMQHAAQG